ncbi:MFS transporter [Ammoniphilus resinae]|uniref:EmrB/QacA subfamily drug resistance transporter n=1 Tax=Ammoniphilus resinae TaxID=861532 RepID=A0ABS4GPB5_9BACL|nr:MFS transporter [Ammoniphilus resinae]MBP1932119.1 EmrB/QacA subfamily drug resistance transporter [Ammoniphilus resinae]
MESAKLRWCLFLILTGTFLVPLNSTMIAVGLPIIAEELRVSLAEASWIITVYLIVMTVTQPMAGKLGDMYGYRRLFLVGMGLFLVASVLCIVSDNLVWLILFRGLQAMGGALCTPNATAILRYLIAKERLAKTLGVFGFSMGIGAAVGPLLGAYLIDWWGWTSIFWVNIPFALVCLGGCFWLLPKLANQREAQLDLLGSLFLGCTLVMLVLLVTHPEYIAFWTVLLCLVSLVLFFLQERRCPYPLIDFVLFRNRLFTCANLSILLSNTVMYSTILVMPIMLENLFGYTLPEVGMMLFAFSLSMSVSSWLGGQISERMGTRWMIMLSFLLSVMATGGYLSFLWLHAAAYMTFVLLLGGLGAGIGLSAMQNASLQSVPRTVSGVASGIYSTFRYIGGMCASVMVSLMFGFHWLFIVLMAISVVGVVVGHGSTLSPSSRKQAEGGVQAG